MLPSEGRAGKYCEQSGEVMFFHPRLILVYGSRKLFLGKDRNPKIGRNSS